jgi:hypothetical protein
MSVSVFPLTIGRVSDREISLNPVTGKVTGDVDPSVTQEGLITKFTVADEETATPLVDDADTFDAHDHGANGGGKKIGEDGIRGIAPNGVDNAALDAGSIRGSKTMLAALDSAEVEDDSVEWDQIGIPSAHYFGGLGSGDTATWNHNRGEMLVYHVEVDDESAEGFKTLADLDSITVKNTGVGISAGGAIKAYSVTT